MTNLLFKEELPKNNDPVQEGFDITTTILYYSTQELKEFRKLCKEGLKQMFGEDVATRANIADLILTLLKDKYEC